MNLPRLTCLLSVACVLVFSQTAQAAESAQYFNWTGPYAGVHLGYGWGNADTYVDPLPLPRISDDQAPSTVSPNPSGVFGGAQAGYNYQMGCFVVGIEADLSVSDISGSRSVFPIINNDGTTWPGTVSAHESINWFGTLRPRLGYTVTPNVLIYATGGLAFGDVSYSANGYDPVIAYPASVSTTKVGWVLGGGVEYAVSRCWTIKAEYLYMDLGSESALSTMNGPFYISYDWQTTANIFQIGVNYKF